MKTGRRKTAHFFGVVYLDKLRMPCKSQSQTFTLRKLRMPCYYVIVKQRRKTMEKKIKKQLKEFLQEYAKPELEGWAWLNLPNNLLCVLDWQNGYDVNEQSMFISDGYGLNASIRVDAGQYFKDDNPYPVVNGECLDTYTIGEGDVKENFSSLVDELYDNFIIASGVQE